MTDKEIGEKALRTYFGYMRSMYPATFKYSLPEFMVIISKLRGGKALAEGLGLGIRETEMSDSSVSVSMKRVAQMGGGKIPASMMDFFNALIKHSSNINFVDAAAYVVVESLKDAGKAAQAVGSQLIFTGKILTFILPVVILAFVYFWLDGKSNGRISRAMK